MRPLAGKIAVVTGGSRGIGRGIALALGDAGATVYVTGRTITPGATPLPGTIGDTARGVDMRGGRGIAVQVDHADDAQATALFDRVAADHGRLDLLVNNAIAIPDTMTDRAGFWEKPLANWAMFDIGVRAAFVASRAAARIMAPRRAGLIVALSGYVGVTYTYDVIFGATKAATDRMIRDMGRELAPHGVAALSLWQGFTHTERATGNLRSVAGMASQLNARAGSSVEFPGRVIAALAADAGIMRRNGGTFISAELATEYGVTDIDGRVIPSLRAERGAPIWRPVGEGDGA
ncbi:MAG: SDR family NAD(P)-dependent oxidoreductase [Sphingomonas sp.]